MTLNKVIIIHQGKVRGFRLAYLPLFYEASGVEATATRRSDRRGNRSLEDNSLLSIFGFHGRDRR